MTDAWIAALIAAIGATGAAAISVFGGRGRLHRMEVVSRILNDLPAESSARETLTEVLKDDAEDLLRARRSPTTFLFWLGLVSYAVLLVLVSFGDEISAWSPAVYLSLAIVMIIGFALFVLGGVAIGVLLFARWVRVVVRSRRNRAAIGPHDDAEAA